MGAVTAGALNLNQALMSFVCVQLAARQFRDVRSCYTASWPVSFRAATRCSCPAEGVTQIPLNQQR